MNILDELQDILIEESKELKELKDKMVQKPKIKPSKMHLLLNIPADKDISSKYTSGESLALALAKKCGGVNNVESLTKAIKMLTFAGNTSNDAMFKTAKNNLINRKEAILNKE